MTTNAGSSRAHRFFVCFLYVVCRYTTRGLVHIKYACHAVYSRSICLHFSSRRTYGGNPLPRYRWGSTFRG